jgi:pyruvate/2-oxoglutarate dehydrogenase complex dihydrolipoamide acyltransferase (E2) component
MAMSNEEKRAREQLIANMEKGGWKASDGTTLPAGTKTQTGQYSWNERFGKDNRKEYNGSLMFFRPGDPAPQAAPPPEPAPDPTPPPAPVAPAFNQPAVVAAQGNPELTIPGVDVRVTGENIGLKAKRSSAKQQGLTSKGTNRLTIPRSSGSNPLNI